VALSFASEYPDFVDNLCVISCTGMTSRLWTQSGDTHRSVLRNTTGKSTPGSVALRHIQRQAVLRDPNYWYS
jgi:homoserine acetyltransferase